MKKETLRSVYRQRRRELTEDQRFTMSWQIAEQFFADLSVQRCLATPGAVMHTYLPIPKQGEVDTWPIIRRVWQTYPAVRTGSSITEVNNSSLRHFWLDATTPLVETNWGIPVPTGTFGLMTESPMLVLVPLLTFDEQGHRVGYGGGYYDRFLAGVRPDCLKIGLSFFDPVTIIDELETTDIRLDRCITPEQVYLFS